MCAISRASSSAWYRIRKNTFPCESNIAYKKMHFHERQHVLSGILPGIPWRHGIPLVGFPGSCHSKLAWPWTESTATMSDKKSCGIKLTYEQLSATANFIWFRLTFCLQRRTTSKISCSLLAILCFDRQGQGHEHARCKHISRAGKIAYEKFAHWATELRTRNHPHAISHTWKTGLTEQLIERSPIKPATGSVSLTGEACRDLCLTFQTLETVYLYLDHVNGDTISLTLSRM